MDMWSEGDIYSKGFGWDFYYLLATSVKLKKGNISQGIKKEIYGLVDETPLELMT